MNKSFQDRFPGLDFSSTVIALSGRIGKRHTMIILLGYMRSTHYRSTRGG
jgi:hypothetical protein